MDLNVKKFIDGLFAKEAFDKPSDNCGPDEIVLKLPEWYSKEEFEKGRRFYWDNCFSFSSTMMMGLVAVLAIPSILKVLIASYRSTTVYTAYKRYTSTFLHTVSWFEHELEPGSLSWKSLHAVRKRHRSAGMSSALKGIGTVSQRDLALTQFGFIGFSILKADQYGIRQLRTGDWEGYNHFWRVIGHMIGLEDRYNICRKSFEETREVCQILLDRVFTPCLENVPEYYEHMARVLLDGLGLMTPINTEAALFYCKYLGNVPGYIYTENDRMETCKKILQHLKGKPLNTGVDSSLLMEKPAIGGLPDNQPRLLYLQDYDTLETSPPYKQLSWYEKYKLNSTLFYLKFYQTYLGRLTLNLVFIWDCFLMKNFPYGAFFRLGIRKSFVNIFKEDPIDHTEPKENAIYYKQRKLESSTPWYLCWIPTQYLIYFGYFIRIEN